MGGRLHATRLRRSIWHACEELHKASGGSSVPGGAGRRSGSLTEVLVESERDDQMVKRDRMAELAEMAQRAREIPGVAEVAQVYAAYERTVAQVAALTRVPVPMSSATAGTTQ